MCIDSGAYDRLMNGVRSSNSLHALLIDQFTLIVYIARDSVVQSRNEFVHWRAYCRLATYICFHN